MGTQRKEEAEDHNPKHTNIITRQRNNLLKTLIHVLDLENTCQMETNQTNIVSPKLKNEQDKVWHKVTKPNYNLT